MKTDRRDALKLARTYRAGELTAVWVPDAQHEALRDLVRAREAAKKDQLRAKHRLGKFLMRHGRRPPTGVKSWTLKYLTWVKQGVHFEQPAQEATLLDYLHMRRLLNQAANAATRTKRSIFEIVYRRSVPRLEHNQAIGAIANRQCRLIWLILHQGSATKNGAPRSPNNRTKSALREWIRQLRTLGYRIEPPNPPPGQAQAQ